MHIPDGFLSPAVWGTLDAISFPAIAYISRAARFESDQSRLPLLGVMGAFVFAAQMINFPVGPGTSGHLVGGALLAFTLGPMCASLALTAILLIQALVFQDGGLLALGANVMNMALLGVWVAYLPFRAFGQSRYRKFAIFGGATLSLLISALAALSELLISGNPMPGPTLGISLALFTVSAILEGTITLAVFQAIERLSPKLVAAPEKGLGKMGALMALAAILLATFGIFAASAEPDGIQSFAAQTGIAAHAWSLFHTPLSDYQLAFVESVWLKKVGAGLLGLALIYVCCLAIRRLISKPVLLVPSHSPQPETE